MSNQIFADTLGGILVTAGTVRIDFVVISPSNGANQAGLELQQRVIMPVDGFLRAAAKIQEAVQALSKPSDASARPATPAAGGTETGKVPFP